MKKDVERARSPKTSLVILYFHVKLSSPSFEDGQEKGKRRERGRERDDDRKIQKEGERLLEKGICLMSNCRDLLTFGH